jgi:antitoxin VapB
MKTTWHKYILKYILVLEVIIMQTAKLFANDKSQAVRLPKDCRFSGAEVYAQRVGEAVMLFPKERAWETFLLGINGFTEDFKHIQI